MEFNIKKIKEANDYRARIKKFIVDTDNLRDNLFLFVTDVCGGDPECVPYRILPTPCSPCMWG